MLLLGSGGAVQKSTPLNVLSSLASLVLIFVATVAANDSSNAHAEKLGSLDNTQILIFRHAEEEGDGEGLSSEGQARAQAYVNYFQTLKVKGQPLKVNYIFAAKNSTNSFRPRLTIEPTARALGLQVDSHFKAKDYAKLAQEIKKLPEGSTVLICWRHTLIPKLLRELGDDPETLIPKGKWPNDVYGWLIVLRYDANGKLSDSKRNNEHLMPDDSNKHSLAKP